MRGIRSSSLLETTDFASFEADWLRLQHQVPHASPFSQPWWLRHVGEGTPVHLLVRDGGTDDAPVVGGVALTSHQVLGVQVLRAPGQGVPCPDHVDLLAVPGHESAVVAAFGAWFRAGNRLLDLDGAPEDPLAARAVGARPQPVAVAPYEPLVSPWLATRSRNFRSQVKRNQRRLAAAGAVRRWRADATTLPAALDAFEVLHRGRPGRDRLLAEMHRLRPAVAEAVALGEARVDVLELDATVVAVSITFLVDGRVGVYQHARSTTREHDGAGNVLLAQVVEECAAQGCTELDMLRGDEAYKRGFASQVRVLTRVRAASGRRAALLLAALTARDRARRTAGAVRRRLRERRTPA